MAKPPLATPSTSNTDRTAGKPSILIIGGLGYIGRFLCTHIHKHSLASRVRIVDKILPQLARLSPEHAAILNPCIPPFSFVQADASRLASLGRVFDKDASDPARDAPWDYVINLGGETGLAQADEVYRIRNVELSLALGREAARRGVRAFVETSTGMVYRPPSDSARTPRRETDRLKPWGKLARAKLEAERELSRVPGLRLVIVRLAHVYGEYNAGFVAKALCLARVYQEEDRELKWLWSEDLRINTVWVGDVVRALCEVAAWRAAGGTLAAAGEGVGDEGERKGGRRGTLTGALKASVSGSGSADEELGPTADTPVFNVVDPGNTRQGTLAGIVSTVFGIKTGFQGSLISQFAKMNLDHVVDELNEDILQPWADLLQQAAIKDAGNLTPFLEKELLRDTDLSLDGRRLGRVLDGGFVYERKGLSVEDVKEMIDSYKRMGWWP